MPGRWPNPGSAARSCRTTATPSPCSPCAICCAAAGSGVCSICRPDLPTTTASTGPGAGPTPSATRWTTPWSWTVRSITSTCSATLPAATRSRSSAALSIRPGRLSKVIPPASTSSNSTTTPAPPTRPTCNRPGNPTAGTGSTTGAECEDGAITSANGDTIVVTRAGEIEAEIPVGEDPRRGHARVLEQFLDWIEHDVEPECTFADNLKSVALMFAARATGHRRHAVSVEEFPARAGLTDQSSYSAIYPVPCRGTIAISSSNATCGRQASLSRAIAGPPLQHHCSRPTPPRHGDDPRVAGRFAQIKRR